jgi:hypothetical protein
MQPIPRIALRHNITFESLTSQNADGDGVYATAQSVFFVMGEPVKDWKLASDGEMKDDKLTLFYDCVNSDPPGLTFKKGDKITFNSNIFIVRTIKDFTPHHVEVVLK